jgi:hypothetical protein
LGGPVQLSIAPFFIGINDTLRTKAFPDGTMFSGRMSSPATLGHVVNFYNEPFTFNLSA